MFVSDWTVLLSLAQLDFATSFSVVLHPWTFGCTSHGRTILRGKRKPRSKTRKIIAKILKVSKHPHYVRHRVNSAITDTPIAIRTAVVKSPVKINCRRLTEINSSRYKGSWLSFLLRKLLHCCLTWLIPKREGFTATDYVPNISENIRTYLPLRLRRRLPRRTSLVSLRF